MNKILCICILKTVIPSSVSTPLLAKISNLQNNCFSKPHNKQVSSDQLSLSLAEIVFTPQLLLASFSLCIAAASRDHSQVGKSHPSPPGCPWPHTAPLHQPPGTPDCLRSSLETSLPFPVSLERVFHGSSEGQILHANSSQAFKPPA